MSGRISIILFLLMAFLLVGCSMKLTESRYGEYSSYEKYESTFMVKNKEGLERGEAKIPRVKKQIFRVRLDNESVIKFKWIAKRPIIGNRFRAHIDSTLIKESLATLNSTNDSAIGTYHFVNLEKQIAKKKGNSADILISSIRPSSNRRSRKIVLLENGKCRYEEYLPGGPDSGGGMQLNREGIYLTKADTLIAILYQDVNYKIPIKPFEIKLIKNSNCDTLKSINEDNVWDKYGYVKLKQN